MPTLPSILLPLDPRHAERVRAALTGERVILMSQTPAQVAVLWGPVGLQAQVRCLREAGVDQVIGVLEATDATTVRRAVEDGLDAAVPEATLQRALPVALRGVLAGLTVVPSTSRGRLTPPALSHRERQVLCLLVEGHTNAEIGTRLFLAESTIKSHVSSAFAKLGVRSRRDAIAVLLDPVGGLAERVLGSVDASTSRRFGPVTVPAVQLR